MATAKSKSGHNVTDFFELHDIALWETSLVREGEYDSSVHAGRCHVQSMQAVVPELYRATPEGTDNEVMLLRALVTLGVRSVYKSEPQDPEVALFTLQATFGVDYVLKDAPPADLFKEFVEFNCVHNVWPFWRQHVYDTLKRASLPVPAVPLFSGKPSGRRKKKLGQLAKVRSAEDLG